MKARLLRLLGFDPTALASGWLLERRGTDERARDAVLESFVARRQLVRLLRQYQIDCVLDVGANEGQFGRDLRQHGFDGDIVSFEPVAEAREALARSADRDPRWTHHPYALGRERRTAVLNVLAGTTLSSLHQPNAYSALRFGGRAVVTRVEEVEVRRLDDVFDETVGHLKTPRLLLKMDTQGHDLEVFHGAGGRLAEIVALQSELTLMPLYDGMPRMSEAMTVYEGAGFEVTGLYPVSRDHATGRVIDYDCVMVRPRSVAS